MKLGPGQMARIAEGNRRFLADPARSGRLPETERALIQGRTDGFERLLRESSRCVRCGRELEGPQERRGRDRPGVHHEDLTLALCDSASSVDRHFFGEWGGSAEAGSQSARA